MTFATTPTASAEPTMRHSDLEYAARLWSQLAVVLWGLAIGLGAGWALTTWVGI